MKTFDRGSRHVLLLLLFLSQAAAFCARADSVVVFNEIMYHPLTNEPAMEWVELHNQMAVDVDLSGWSLQGGVEFTFPEGAVIPGGGYVVVAASPADLAAIATGLTNLFGPFAGRLSNAGEKLELRNNNQRLMDSVSYGVEGDWPVAPDGSGVSLAKRDEETASPPAANWTVSALTGGTPGGRNFAAQPFEITSSTPVLLNSTWKFDASGNDLGSVWRQLDYDDSAWASGAALFTAGQVGLPMDDPQPVPTAFSTGVGANGTVLSPGTPDSHYLLTQSAQGSPPPPPIAATVILNHPAWFANDTLSSWIGPVNPGEANVAAGPYNYRTSFNLDGFDPATASLKMNIGADNRMNDVLLNGISQGLSYVGFSTLSGDLNITGGFVPGTNTLDFLTANDGDGPNPAGFRAKVSVTARKQLSSNTTLPAGYTSYFFRSRFVLGVPPRLAALSLNALTADGAVFYLNGTEVLRLNMPAGPVGASTLAVSNVPSPAYVGPFELPTSSLVVGTNILAVEVHPASGGTNNHLLFGAELSLTTTNVLVPPPVTLAFNELSSATNADFWIELINYGTSEVDLGGCVLARRGGATNRDYTFPSLTLGPGGFLQLTKAVLGFGADPGDRLFLYSPGQTSVLDAVVAKREARARWPDGIGQWGFPTALTPASSNCFVFHNQVVINEIMYHPPGLPPTTASASTNTLVSITNAWRYYSLGQEPGDGWETPGFDDSSWQSGQGLFYNTTSLLPAPKGTELPLTTANGTPVTTWYFRTPFMFTGTGNSADLVLHPLVDDGAVYYLNGTELFRQNMPAGEIHYTNFASAGVATPAYAGPFTVSVSNLLSGTNLLAVEVHQFTTNPIAADMAFGVEVTTSGPMLPALPFRESPESWVELFNRGANSVDLTGWRFDGGIDYRFDAGTTIPAGGYLVVAKDLDFMRATYPGIPLVGPFTNALSHKSDDLLLKDAANNLADEVRYFDGGRWPEYAHGGGSSLELRDPWADNSKAETWAASDESRGSGWSNYTYRAVARNALGPTLWKDFAIGLLDAGECLIDDIHVVESPATAPVEMLQNGSFETGFSAWRALGTHSHSRVEVDPDNPGNHVLHLVATGPTEHIHNHLETTFAGGRAVVDGREYEISFRAKWLAGNNRLNTRLYFNRVSRTTVLPMSPRHGTPGAPNSVLVTNLGPTFASFAHSPVVPKPNQPISIGVDASDPQGVSSLTIFWSVNSGRWQSAPMLERGSASEPGYESYSGSIPGQAAGALVQFYVQAVDRLGAVSTFPARGPNSRALVKVDEGKPLMTQLHRLRLLMLPAEAALLHASTNVMSNDLMGLTVVYDEREVFYDVGVHLQSSERGRDDTSRVGFTVTFSPDRLFRGAQNTFTIDRSGGYSGLGGRHDEILLWHAVNHAGGLLGLDCDLVQLFAPRSQEDSTGLMRLSAFDAAYFDNQFKNGGDGNLYKLELIYYPLTTTTGDPQAPKLPQPDDVINVDIQNRGSDPESYRWIFLQENNADTDDYSQVIALNQAFSLTGSLLDTQTRKLMDIDQWMRTLAFKAFTGEGDTFTFGLNHNFKVYFRPEDGKALGLLWDMDYNFVQSINYGFPGNGSATTYRLNTLPDNYRRYYNHLLDMITTTVNSAHLRPWAARYAGLLGQDWSGAVNYLQQRADYIRSRMPLSTAFAITSNAGNDFSTSTNRVTLTGTAPLTVKDIAVNGVVYPVTWTGLANWSLTVPLPSSVNQLALQGRDNYGANLPNAVDSITVTNLGPPAPQPVVINEWMAHNAGPAGFADPVDGRFQDWFELYNPNDALVDLSGFYLTDTLLEPTKWQIPTNTTIATRGFLLVWADSEATQNGLGTNGDLHANFQLGQTGETLALYAPDGTLQHAVAFGPQTQNVSQGLFPDGNTNAVYFMTNWTPRAANVLGPPPAPQIGQSFVQPGGAVVLRCGVIPGRTYQVEYKEDLAAPAWLPLGAYHIATGPEMVIVDSAGGSGQRFYRLSLLQ